MLLKPLHHDTVIGQILRANAAVVYHETHIASHLSGMADQTRKGYEQTYAENMAKVAELQAALRRDEAIFTNILSDYNLSVATFLVKYIKQIQTPEQNRRDSDFAAMKQSGGRWVEIAEETYDEALGAVPPTYFNGGWAMGEPVKGDLYYCFKSAFDKCFGTLASIESAAKGLRHASSFEIPEFA